MATISLLWWFVAFAAYTLFMLWIMRWGGADWVEGWKSLFFISWLYAPFWNAEQIKLYVLLTWIVSAVWFVIGLFNPAARVFV